MGTQARGPESLARHLDSQGPESQPAGSGWSGRKVNGDKLTRWTAFVAVLAVAAVAAWISYRHAVEIVSAHGEPGAVGRMYPVVIDGLIIAASMVLLDAARYRESAPALAWWLLSAGIGATLAVNVLAGVPSGPLGAIVAAWPAAAFVGCYELLMMLVRASARRAATEPESAPETIGLAAVSSLVPADAESAALIALRATLAAGNPLSGRQLESRFGLTRAQATNVRRLVSSEANGHELADSANAAET
jgi:hypothetical protein